MLMLNTIRQYVTWDTKMGFLQFKQSVVGNKYWLSFFYIHIFSIIGCLLAGLTQFSTDFLKNHKRLHRIIGKIYVYNILLINFPACFVLALFSNGGMIGIIGFCIQNLLWGYFTLMAVYYIKNKQVVQHKKFMILSYAITITALTFRGIKNIFYDESTFDYELFYGINVWISLIFNLIIAQLIIYKTNKKLSLKRNRINKDKKDHSVQ